MNALTPTQVDEVQQIEAAMDALLRVCTDRNAPRPATVENDTFRVYSMRDLAAEMLAKESWTPAQRAADKLLRDPVGIACRQAIRTLAERLYEVGGLKALEDACDRVADMDPDRWGWRTDIMDKRFDGIGFEDGKTGWLA